MHSCIKRCTLSRFAFYDRRKGILLPSLSPLARSLSLPESLKICTISVRGEARIPLSNIPIIPSSSFLVGCQLSSLFLPFLPTSCKVARPISPLACKYIHIYDWEYGISLDCESKVKIKTFRVRFDERLLFQREKLVCFCRRLTRVILSENDINSINSQLE